MKSRAGLFREEMQEGTGEGGADGRITKCLLQTRSSLRSLFTYPQISSAVNGTIDQVILYMWMLCEYTYSSVILPALPCV